MAGTAQTGVRALVAGIGNIFLRDDGFGVEVVRRLAARGVPPDVAVVDAGIRGVHLAFDMLERGCGLTILVDALPRGGTPGTVYLFEPEAGADEGAVADAHAMTPDAVLAYLRAIGGVPGKVLVVGCEPQTVEEGMALSEPVEAAVPRAVDLVLDVLERERSCV